MTFRCTVICDDGSWIGNYDDPDVKDPAPIPLQVGEMYKLSVGYGSSARVLLLSLPQLNEADELRAHVVALENDHFLKAGRQYRPLAYTLRSPR